MIVGIGVDTVDIERFFLWHMYQQKTLRRIFSQEEIDYCLADVVNSAQRFAVRFAAREALYKALSFAYPHKKIPFLTLCAHVIITKINSRPYCIIRDGLDVNFDDLIIHLSLSHSWTLATAFVVIETKINYTE
jgi:phosphopantetheine--protein transferase-like protein